MKFKFSLQTVLDVKHFRVEAFEIQLGQLNREQRKMERILTSLQESLVDVLGSLKEQQLLQEFDLFLLMRLHENAVFIEEQIKMTKEDLANIQKKIEAKRKEIILARQEEEVMEILKQKEYQRLLEAIEVAERKEVDDMYIFRAYRMGKLKN